MRFWQGPWIAILALLLALVGRAGLRTRQAAADEARIADRLDAAERMAARWARLPEAQRISATLPDRQSWNRCIANLGAPGCEAVLEAALRHLPTAAEPGHTLVRSVGATRFLSEAQAPVPAVLSWGPAPFRSTAEARVHALLLGQALGLHPGVTSLEAAGDLLVHALEPLRAYYAPGRRALSLPDLPPGPVAVPISRAAALLERTALPARDPAPPMGAWAAAVRRGEPVPEAAWTMAGGAGLVALELGAAGRKDALGRILDLALSGPTAGDRLAALYAARRLSPPEDWPSEEAKARWERYRLEAGSR